MSETTSPCDWSPLPESLKTAAFWADREPAWRRDEACTAVDWLSRKRIAVYGVEVWVPHEDGRPEIPQPFTYGWTAPSPAGKEEWGEYVERVNPLASEYVQHFSWDPRDEVYKSQEPFFCLTVGDSWVNSSSVE